MTKASRRAALSVVLPFVCATLALAQTPAPKPKPKPKAATRAPAAAPKPAEPRPAPPPPSVTVTTKYSSGDEVMVSTVHSSGARQRFEFANGRTLIVQCDTKKAIQVSDLARSYVVSPLAEAPATPAAPSEGAKGGPVSLKTTITDTGERKELFGLQARRVTTVTTREPSASACDKRRTRSETDGWYADLPVAMECGTPQPAAAASDKPECADVPVTERTGPESALGYPLSYATTSTAEGGKILSTVRMEVTGLTRQAADRFMYEAPAGYTALKDAQELARAEQAARGDQPKASGVVRIGVVLPKNSASAAVAPDAIGNELLASLASPPYEPVALDATEPAEIDAEARQKECDYVLFTDLVGAKTSAPGRIGGMMRKVSRSDSTENHEAKVQYRLLAPASAKPVLDKTATAKSGAGFNVRSALSVARLAARIYFGLNAGIMQAVLAGAGGGAAAADPMTNALNMVMALGAPKQPAADTLEGVIAEAVQAQSADIIKAISKR